MLKTWTNRLAGTILATAALASLLSCTPHDSANAPTPEGTFVTKTPEPTPSVVVVIPGVSERSEPLPCTDGQWLGIQPGVTNEEELRQWLDATPVVNRSTFRESSSTMPDGSLAHHYQWSARGTAGFVTVMAVSGTVTFLAFTINYSLTLGDVVDELGPPEYVTAMAPMMYEGYCPYDYDLYYPSLGVRFSGTQSICDRIERDPQTGRETGPLEREMRIYFITCNQPDSIVDMVQHGGLRTREEALEFVGQLQEWSGFGMIPLSDLWLGP